MRNPLPNTIALLCLLACAQPAEASTLRSESIEWQTDQADVVVIAEVHEKASGNSNGTDPQATAPVFCQVVACLKGEWQGEIEIGEIMHYQSSKLQPANGSPPPPVRYLAVGEHVLVFLSQDTRGIAVREEGWVYLESPADRARGVYPLQHASFSNEGRKLETEEEIVALVRSRQGHEAGRGLVIHRPLQPGEVVRDYTHYFIVTAEPEFKQEFLDHARSQESDLRLHGISNLISYPGAETEALLRDLLNDPTYTAVAGQTGLRHYPIRQAAYEALLELGVEVDPPETYLTSRCRLQGSVWFALYPSRHEPWTADYDPSQSWRGWLAPLALALGLPPLGLLLVWRRGRFSLRSLVLVVAIAAVLCGLCAGPVNTVLAGPNVKGELRMWLSGVGPTAGACLAGSLVVTLCVGVGLYLWKRRLRQRTLRAAAAVALVLLSTGPVWATSYAQPRRHHVFSPNGKYVLDVDPELEIHTVYAATDRTQPLWSFSRGMWHDPVFLSNDGQRVAVVSWRHVKEEAVAADAVCVTIHSAEALESAFTYQQLCTEPLRTSQWGIGPRGDSWRTWYDEATQTGDTLTLVTTDGKEVAIDMATGEATARRTLPAARILLSYDRLMLIGIGVVLLLALLALGRKQPRAAAVGGAALLVLLAITGLQAGRWWFEAPAVPPAGASALAAIAEYETGRAEALAAPAGESLVVRQVGYATIGSLRPAYLQQLEDAYGVTIEEQAAYLYAPAPVQGPSPFAAQGYNSVTLARLIEAHKENVFRTALEQAESAVQEVGYQAQADLPGGVILERLENIDFSEPAP